MRQSLPSPLLLLLAVVLAVLLARPVQAQTPPAAAPDWEQVAAELIQRPEFEALPLQIRPPRGQSLGGSPIEMQFQAGQCLLNLRTRGNPAAATLLAQAAPEDRTLWMQAVIAHEIAHCWRSQQGDDPGLQQLATLMATARPDSAGASQVQRQLHTEESFADAAALAWVATVAPQRFEPILQAFQRLRSDLRQSSGPHDTRAVLHRIRREGFAAGRPMFLAAKALLQGAP